MTTKDKQTHWQAAYESTEYQLLTQPILSVSIGPTSPQVAALLCQNKVQQAILITSDNPLSQQLDERCNGSRRDALANQLKTMNMPVVATRHVATSGSWPDEMGFCVFGLPLDEGKRLGRLFEQNAIVRITASKTELFWL